jgi:hypothetical protein
MWFALGGDASLVVGVVMVRVVTEPVPLLVELVLIGALYQKPIATNISWRQVYATMNTILPSEG